MMLAVLFLGESAGWRRWLAALIGFPGVIAIAAALCMGAEMAALIMGLAPW
jgi:drug/metabolite transporter (DMT)-like permease